MPFCFQTSRIFRFNTKRQFPFQSVKVGIYWDYTKLYLYPESVISLFFFYF